MRTIALLGDDMLEINRILEILLDKNSDFTEFNEKSIWRFSFQERISIGRECSLLFFYGVLLQF